MRRAILFLCVLLVGVFACRSAIAPSPTEPRAGTPTFIGTVSLERGWSGLVVEAQKEGTIIIYAAAIGEARQALINAFREKYGISLDIVMSKGEDLVAKIDFERRAGIYGVDAGLFGMTTFFNSIKPRGITVPIEPLLVLPEVLDTSKWRQGKLPLADKEGHLAVLVLGPMPAMVANTDMVEPGVITTHLDLLDARWYGKLVMQDPSVSGAGTEWFTFVVKEMMGIEKGTAFMKQLARQGIAVTRDPRLVVEWVGRGKYAVAVAPDRSIAVEFMRAGSPVAFLELKEPRPTGSAAGNVMVFDRAPHPNATQLFINWLLSKEGIAVYSQGHGLASTRLDVSTEGIDPFLIPRPDEAILGEEYQLAKGQMTKLAAEIFRELIK